jgi:hypothetical protein
MSEIVLTADSPPDAKGHRWFLRDFQAYATLDAFKSGMELFRPMFADVEALNVEVKVPVRPRPEALLTPAR